jgi:hypothetical protein
MSVFDSRDDRLAARGERTPSAFANRAGQSISLPILADPKAGTIAATTLTNATVLTDTYNGTVYMAVVTNGGTATSAQIIAGSGGNIVAGAASSVAVAGPSLQTVASITSLTTATTYQLLVVQQTTDGRISLQVSKTFITA